MKLLWILLFVLFYVLASINAYKSIQNDPIGSSSFDLKYPFLMALIPINHKFYFMLLYGFFGGLASRML